MTLRKFIKSTIHEHLHNRYLNEQFLMRKDNYVEAKMRRENQKVIDRLFKEAGLEGEFTHDYLDLIGKSVNDLPFPKVLYNENDKFDYVGKNGELLLPSKEIPGSLGSNTYLRPDSKEVWYNGRWFVVHYYHDGSVMDVELKNKI